LRPASVRKPAAASNYWGYRLPAERAFLLARDMAYADQTPVDPRREAVLDRVLLKPKRRGIFGSRRQ
jgi:hypothetical protein